MKKWLSLVASAFLLGSSTALFAATTKAQQQGPSFEQIDAQTKVLEQQITQLKAQVAQLRAAQQHTTQQVAATKNETQSNSKAIQRLNTRTIAANNAPTKQSSQVSTSYPDNFSPDDNGEQQFIRALRDNVSIITSPYLGLRSSYDASDLLVNLPSMNEDLVLLQQRQYMETEAKKYNLPYGNRPLIMLSGDLLPQIIFGNNYQDKAVSQATLSGAELDLHIISGNWAAGFLALNYDSSTPTATGQNVSAVNNSRIYVSRGFVTVGDLNKSPIYLTTGQMYAPYGNYANSLVTTPLTLSLGRSLVRAALLGYSQDGIYAETYAFNGDTYVKNDSVINEGGVNAGYKNSIGDWNYDFGAGYITNIADSQGAQENALSNSSNYFQGFGGPNGSEQIKKHVPGGNLHTEIKYKNFNLNAEYVAALQAYSPYDMTFNGQGAKPRASHVELDYNRALWNKPWTFVLAYDYSWQALAYNLPQQSYFAVVSVSLWKDTIESIEFRHDVNYPTSTTANGSLGSNLSSPTYSNITPAGSSRNTVTMQLGLYF